MCEECSAKFLRGEMGGGEMARDGIVYDAVKDATGRAIEEIVERDLGCKHTSLGDRDPCRECALTRIATLEASHDYHDDLARICNDVYKALGAAGFEDVGIFGEGVPMADCVGRLAAERTTLKTTLALWTWLYSQRRFKLSVLHSGGFGLRDVDTGDWIMHDGIIAWTVATDAIKRAQEIVNE